ncbi:MAG: family 10 glycosylhydrolase [Limnochordaceae bacterium]|nr:family 10 glycosylhydrolase [Limnochordaceae bacterium]
MASSHPRRHVLWIDATANLPRTSSAEGLRSLLGRAREAGFTTVVVDVKPTSGEVLYPSRLAPVLRQWRSGVSLPAGYDLLGTAVEMAYREALELFASVNVFCEGAVHEGRLRGLLAGDPARAGWEVVAYREGRLDRLTRFAEERWAFVDPANPEVQAYELGILREILAAYPVAGIVLDRARYPGIVADFGEHTRRRLEALVGRAVARWPEDVYEEADPGAASGGEGAAAHEDRVRGRPHHGRPLDPPRALVRRLAPAAGAGDPGVDGSGPPHGVRHTARRAARGVCGQLVSRLP